MGSISEVPLLTPYKMGPFELSHRIVYAPLTRCRAFGNIPQPAAVTYYSQRASKGGFMLTEATAISQDGHGYPCVPGIHTSTQIEAWKPIVKAVHDKGAIIFCQLWHVGRASHAEYQTNGGAPVSSSAVRISSGEKVYTPTGNVADYPTPRALEVDEIPGIVELYVAAARNAILAGFDGVEIHSANGYLLDQFLKDGVNKRSDQYGGSYENRARFLLEVIDAVAAEVGAPKVGVRFSPFGDFLDAVDSNPVPLFTYVAEEVSKREILYTHWVGPRVSGSEERGNIGKDEALTPFRNGFKGTFIAAGGYNRESGIKSLESGEADLICYGRIFLANPDLPIRFQSADIPLNKYDRKTFYTQDQVVGYTDYPFLEE